MNHVLCLVLIIKMIKTNRRTILLKQISKDIDLNAINNINLLGILEFHIR